VRRASISVKDSDTSLNETTVLAPFAGRLSEVSATVGGRVANNEKLGVLIDPTALEVKFNIRDDVFGRLVNDRGQLRPLRVTVSLELGERTVDVPGILDRDAPVVDATRGGRVVYARLETGDGTLVRPGDFVAVTVTEPVLNNVVSIPASAISESNRIFVLDNDNRLEEVSVNIVRRFGDQVVIAEPPLGRQYVTARGGDKTAGSAPPDMIKLKPERREKLMAFIKENKRIPEDRRQRILANLEKPKVKRAMVERIESRM